MYPYATHILAWLKFSAFYAINRIFSVIMYLIWCLNGTMAEVRRRRDSMECVNNCHRMSVKFCYFIDILFPISQKNFVLAHDSFVSPDYVLHDEVSLLRVTQTEAIFVEQDKSMQPAFSNEYSFATIGQVTTARYIIVVPLQSFLELAERMENNEEKILIVHNITRCGGTLLTSCFGATGRAVAWNEPRVIDHIITRANFYWNRNTTKRLLRAAFLMLGKTYSGFTESTLAYIIKPAALNSSLGDLMFEALPKAQYLFLYRDVNVTARSCNKVSMLVPSLIFLQLARFIKLPYTLAYLMDITHLNARGFGNITYRSPLLVEFSYRLHLNVFKAYFRLRDNRVPIQAVRYEDLTGEPDRILRQLLKLASMPEELVNLAKTAFRHDSQSAVPFSRDGMDTLRKKAGEEEISDAFLEEMQGLYAQYGVPGPLDWKRQSQILPGTIQ